MPLGTYHRETGYLHWDREFGCARLDRAGGGFWLLELPRRGRRLLGHHVEVAGHRCGFNLLAVNSLRPLDP